MKINIIAIGKLQQKWENIFQDFKQRISPWAKINIIEIKEQNNNLIQKKLKETELIIKSIPKNSTVYLCSLKGDEYSSKEFSEIISADNITFIIGGSNGVIEEKFTKKIKFSNFTFPHQFFRIMLVEQIYRAFTIQKNMKYHK